VIYRSMNAAVNLHSRTLPIPNPLDVIRIQ
jgi:hypothetical protein